MSATATTEVTIALVGNPNTGKTTLFNALTGLSHRVGNYPGVTVEHKSGTFRLGDQTVRLVDLPGTYSMAARSKDELIAVDSLLQGATQERGPDGIIAILDATNLPRNLYLLSQLLELELPLVVALNMTDLARGRGIEISARRLGQRLGVSVVPTSADRGEGVERLKEALAEELNRPRIRLRPLPEFPRSLAERVDALHEWLTAREATLGRPVTRPEALRALVDIDGEFEYRLARSLGEAFSEKLAELRRPGGDARSLPSQEAHARYGWVQTIVEGCLQQRNVSETTPTDRLDAILTHRLWGSLALILVLGAVFQAIYAWSAPVMASIEGVFSGLAALAEGHVASGPVQSLLIDGVIGGVGAVAVFLPQILLLVFFITLLEDCGYMARAAFLADRILVKLGLSGKSVIPLLSSFACAVPGIMATRTIDSRKDRLATILVAPLMSCSARLPVYVLFIGAFVPARSWLGGWVGLQGLVLLASHLIGIVVAVPVLLLLKRFLFRGASAPFLLELPPYRLPNWRNIVSRLVDQGKEFLVRAGSVIFAVTVVIWGLSYYPHPAAIHERFEAARSVAADGTARSRLDQEEAGAYLRQSILGRVGLLVEPVVEQAGWDWRIGMAVTSSFAAREVVIATMGTIFNVGSDVDEASAGLREVLSKATWPDGRRLFNLPVALSLIVFFALCCQCIATLAVIRRETGSWIWPAFTFTYMTVLAYIAAVAVYRLTMWWGW